MLYRFFCLALLSLSLTLVCCDSNNAGVTAADTTRTYHLGFTPFPYELNSAAVDWVYSHIESDADMISHAFDNGIPWVEAYSNAAFSQHIMDDWNLRKSKARANQAVYIQTTPISFDRTQLASYRGTQDDMPLPQPWDTMSFNNPMVKQAYLNYCKRLIDFFQPTYISIGIEVNGLFENRSTKWEAYLELQKDTYLALKQAYPSLNVGVSVMGLYLFSEYAVSTKSSQQQTQLPRILQYSDYFGISLYPYQTVYAANSIPQDMFSRLAAVAGGKRIAITETGYIADTVHFSFITMNGTDEKQREYIELLLNSADKYKFLFVNNFILRDYDHLTAALGMQKDDLFIAWQDTGLYDESGIARPALTVWRDRLRKKKIP